MNILVLRPGAIGDALLSFPVLHALRERHAARHITFVSNASVLPLASLWKLADDVSDFQDTQWSELFATAGIRQLALRQRLEATDLAICWLSDPDQLVERNLRQAGVQKIIIAPGRPPQNSIMHVAEYLASTVSIAAQQVYSWHPLLPAGNPTTNNNDFKTIAIHPGSGSERKCWPIASFADIIKRLWRANYPVLLLAGPADQQRLAYLQAHLAPPPGLYRTLVSAPLLEIARQLQQCQGYLGNDSGITHLAALPGVPTVAIFGPTDPAIWRPMGSNVKVIRGQPLQSLSTDVVLAALPVYV
ncbi:MAG: glycosyltransferase family 9 protein [Ktedonobacteraceae bacterium]